MSLRDSIERIHSAAGVIATGVYPVDGSDGSEYTGPEPHRQLLETANKLLAASGEKGLRAIVGKNTLSLQQVGGYVAAVLLPTGHKTHKSLKRLVQRSGRTRSRKSALPGSGTADATDDIPY